MKLKPLEMVGSLGEKMSLELASSLREEKPLEKVKKKCTECGSFVGGIQKKGTEALGMRFFKIMIGDFASKLCIPPAMARHIKIDKFAKATINSHTGSPWHVTVCRDNNAMFIKHGWRTFVACHYLQFGDFLMFKYNGNLDFDVKIFDRTGCERVAAYLGKNARVYKKEPEEPYDPLKDPPNHSHISEGTQSSRVNHQEVLGHSDRLVAMYTFSYASKRRPVTWKERVTALKAAGSLNLSRPHFISIMSATNVYKTFLLNIPKPFLHELNLKHSLVVTLRSPSGMTWDAKISQRAGGRGEVRHGWGPFSVAHNLEDGDVCIFELTERVNPVIDVHIFRVVEEITPLVRTKENGSRVILKENPEIIYV